MAALFQASSKVQTPTPLINRKEIILILLLLLTTVTTYAQVRDRASVTAISPLYVRTVLLQINSAIDNPGHLCYAGDGFGSTRNAGEAFMHQRGFKLKAGRQKIAGITMVALGGALQIGGIVAMAKGVNDANPENSKGEVEIFLGVAMFAAGTGVAVPGVFLWVKGAKKYKRALESQQGVRLNFSPMPSLSYQF